MYGYLDKTLPEQPKLMLTINYIDIMMIFPPSLVSKFDVASDLDGSTKAVNKSF